jgi:hypothetical protein
MVLGRVGPGFMSLKPNPDWAQHDKAQPGPSPGPSPDGPGLGPARVTSKLSEQQNLLSFVLQAKIVSYAFKLMLNTYGSLPTRVLVSCSDK